MEAVEKMLVIQGSHGQLFVDASTGEILKRMYPCNCGECEGGTYAEIERFNVNDTTREFTFDRHGVCYFDIVRIGYIENNEEYVDPVHGSPYEECKCDTCEVNDENARQARFNLGSPIPVQIRAYPM